MKILVLAGGISPEHDVSMRSGALAAAALSKKGHSVALCDVSRDVSDQKSAAFGAGCGDDFVIPERPPSADDLKRKRGRFVGNGVIGLAKKADICFLALHGGYGEDGHVQALLEDIGALHTGSDMAGCHSAMDKMISKLICREHGIPVPPARLAFDGADDFPLPAVVKPCGCGSSVGVSFIDDKEELRSAIDAAGQYGGSVMVEQMIVGREFSVSVLGDDALPSVEIVPRGGKYDFIRKYGRGMTEEICPGRLTQNEEQTIRRFAKTAHRALGLSDFSRSDFILSGDGQFYYLETNALPGLTENSLLPLSAAAVGISYADLCEKICVLALERNRK